MIRISHSDNPSIHLPNNRKIVHVTLIKKENNGKVLIEINGQKIHARLDTDIPDRFLAVVQIDNDRFNLRVLDSFKHTAEYKSLMQQQYLDQIHDFLVLSGLPLDGNYVEDALMLIKHGLPLNKKFLKILRQARLRFGTSFATLILSLLQKNLSLDEQDLEFLFHLDTILEKWQHENEKELKQDKQKHLTQKEDLIRIIEELLSANTKPEIHYFHLEDSEQTFLRKYSHKKTNTPEIWNFDLSPSPSHCAWLTISQHKTGFSGTLILDSTLYENTKSVKTKILNKKIKNKLKNRTWNLKIRKKLVNESHLFAQDNPEHLTEITTGINIFV